MTARVCRGIIVALVFLAIYTPASAEMIITGVSLSMELAVLRPEKGSSLCTTTRRRGHTSTSCCFMGRRIGTPNPCTSYPLGMAELSLYPVVGRGERFLSAESTGKQILPQEENSPSRSLLTFLRRHVSALCNTASLLRRQRSTKTTCP
jgi:hypothetical protein